MKKLFLGMALVLGLGCGFAQDAPAEEAPKQGWKKAGNFNLLFNQSAFSSSWQAGGASSVAGSLGINYDFNYFSEDITWDNKILVNYGMTKLEDADWQKTDDRLEFNSLFGKKASNNWFYSAYFNFKTQMDIAEVQDSEGKNVKTSHFFSPAYFQLGLGMLWKKSDNLKVNISPLAAKMIVVDDHFTESGSSFGVEQGETTRFELGASLAGYYKLDLMKNVSMENILNLYSNYSEDPQNVDLDYTMNLVMKVNKYLSANLSFQAIYDDNAVKDLQTKEVFGAGLNVAF
ncbi:MAG: DUF3078 domain-containing protein [Flavobacteriaceae bacterium]|nr:DUF3078 domain-containing protein [Flavobacteriaceae bacterium]